MPQINSGSDVMYNNVTAYIPHLILKLSISFAHTGAYKTYPCTNIVLVMWPPQHYLDGTFIFHWKNARVVILHS